MKKLFVLIAALTFIAFGCKKDQPQPSTQLVDVTFSGNLLTKDFGGTKADDCFAEKADWAVITIDGEDYTVDVYYIDGVPYTKAIKLAPKEGDATYEITGFYLYSDFDNNDPNDDAMIAAAPLTDSDYGDFVVQGMPMEFTVGAFVKIEIPVEVLCFEDYEYNEFGFFWFTYDEIIVRTQCFFGDFCVKHPDDYLGSLYAQQDGGLQLDMPAIMQIEVFRNGEPLKVVNNEGWLGEGEPLCVEYPDLLGSVDNYEFVLSVLVKEGNAFQYVEFYTFTFADDEMISAGDDGVVDFVLGNCVQSDADFTFAPYLNLPATCSYHVSNTYAPGTAGGYIDAVLSGIPVSAGYDIWDGTWASWCFDRDVNIYLGQTYVMNVYSSLYPASMPAYLAANDWNRANWIMNHLDWYAGYTWADIQGAIWLLDGWGGGAEAGVPALGTLAFAQQMFDDAVAALAPGDVYAPPPGGYAAVVFGHATEPIVQTVFVVVDP